MIWALYLTLATLGEDATSALNRRWTALRADAERGDLNISTAIYAGLAVTIGAVIVAAITAFVRNKISLLR
jgi:hypothetical protein